MALKGIQDVNLSRLPQEWDPAWFARFVREVLVFADTRNAIEGSGITITGTPDTPATISASDDLQNLLLQTFVLATPSGFLNFERTLDGESGVVSITDNGANSTIEVGIENGGISFGKLQQIGPLSVIGNQFNATQYPSPIFGTAQYDVLHIVNVLGSPVVQFSSIDHNYISDFDEAAQDAVGNIFVDSATIDFTYLDGTPSISAIVIDDSITNAKLRNSVGVSVIGRSANSTGDPADIVAGTDDRVLRQTSSTLNFGQLTVGMFPDDVVTYAKIQNVSATSRVLGRITTGAGDIEELTGANLATIIGTSLGANPTASVGLTAVNGTAGTYLRSDAAPALSQSITPTWTGQHIWDGTGDLVIYKRSGVDKFFVAVDSGGGGFFNATGETGEGLYLLGGSTHESWIFTNSGANHKFGAGYLRGPDGSASVPALSAQNDSNTGWSWPGSDTLRLSLGGSQAMQFNGVTTTGAQTATFIATNKPGSATAGPIAWLPVLTAGGTQGYIPIFGA